MTGQKEADGRLDARGLRCPLPLLLALRRLSDAGEAAIEVVVDDPAAPDDFRAAADAGKLALDEVEELPGPAWRLRIRTA